MPKLILSVHSDSDYYDSCDKAHVDLTPEVARRLLARMEEVRERYGTTPTGSGPYKRLWHDDVPKFLTHTDEELEAETGPLEHWHQTAEALLAPEVFIPSDDKILSVDIPSLHVDCADVWWTVTPRQSDTQLRTVYITHGELEACLEAPVIPPPPDPYLQEFRDTWEQAFVNNENIRGADLVEWGTEWLRRSRGKQ
jgi:hypothetical protein